MIHGEMRGENSAHAIEVGFRAWLAVEFENVRPVTPGLLKERLYGPERERRSLRSDQDKEDP